MDQWEPRELPPLQPATPRRPATGPGQGGVRNGTAQFNPAQRAFVDRFGEGGPPVQARKRGLQREVLGELREQRQARRPLLPPRRPSSFKTMFDRDMLNTLKVQVDRGSVKVLGKEIGKGVGEFEDVVNAAHLLSAAGDGTSAEAQACQQVLAQVRAYCTPERKQAYEHEKAKGNKADAKTVQKYEAALAMRREVQRLQQDRIDAGFTAGRPRQPAEREQAHNDRARQMAQTFGANRAASGTSVVHLIKNGDGKVGYAFKSVAGEPDSTGMPKGAGAVREAMASAMSNAIQEMTGLDFGFPEVTIGTFGNEVGAMVEGLEGLSYDPNWKEGKVRAELGDAPDLVYRKNYGSENEYEAAKAAKRIDDEKRAALRQALDAEAEERKQVASSMAQKLSGKELQKVLMSNYAMAQFDIKWDNMMMAGDGQNTTARPFDGGAGFLADETLAETPHLLDPGEGGAGYILLKDPVDTNQDLPAALADIDPQMRQQFLGIDLNALRVRMETERARLSQDHGLGDKLLPDIAMERSYKSIEIVQEILADPNVRTTRDFVVAYCDRLGELKQPT